MFGWPFRLLVLMWGVHLFQMISTLNFMYFGILPRHISGLKGIILSPMIHGDLFHIVGNSLPFYICGTAIHIFYKKISLQVLLLIWLISGMGVWVIGREAYHIGASGLVFGFASFLFFSGIYRRTIKAILIALVVAFLYSGLIWGILPTNPHISWEAHLCGAIVGLICASMFRNA